jgi:hypothetical protein
MDNNHHSFALAESTLKIAYEGVVFRIIWYDNEMLFVTHRKIRPQKSRWGSSPTFPEMYAAANGPSAEELFDTTKPHSTSCYVILVVHPSLLVATRQRINAPYIVLLAHHQMESELDPALTGPGTPTFPVRTSLTGLVNEPCIVDPPALTLEQANAHLEVGYYKKFTPDDQRMGMGEAIILYRMEGVDVIDVVKIHSPSYEWRSYLRGNNPNIWHRFFELLNLVRKGLKSEDDWNNMEKKLVMFPLYDETSIQDYYERNKMILTFPRGPRSYRTNKDEYHNRDSRVHLLWINFVVSLPAHFQGEALGFLAQYKRSRAEVTKWLQDLELKNRDLTEIKLSNRDLKEIKVLNRAKKIMEDARQSSRRAIAEGTNSTPKNAHVGLPKLIKSSLRNFINKEEGTSLYKIIRLRKLMLNPPAITPADDSVENSSGASTSEPSIAASSSE